MKRCLLIFLLVFLLTGCSSAPVTVQISAMDTAMELTAWGPGAESALFQAEETILELENLFSRTQEQSAVSILNRSPGEEVDVDPSVCRLLEASKDYTAATGGAFDITVAPIMDAWGFAGSSFRVPAREELAELLTHVGTDNLHLPDEDTALLDDGTQIDLGGIAKGYAADCMQSIFQGTDVTSAIAVLGGNVYAHGTRPDGTFWRIGVQDPQDPGAFAGILLLEHAYAVTSGGYQRYFETEEGTYHHIIDPATGYPADSGLLSVTVIASANETAGEIPGNGTMCDALSTALFVMGERAALEFHRAAKYDFEMVLVTDSGRVLITEGLADRFQKNEESGYLYEIIKD